MSGILIDEHLSAKLVRDLAAVFEDVNHVSNLQLGNCSDRDIWDFAEKLGFTLLTKDKDFKDLSGLYGCPPKVIRLRCGNKNTVETVSILLGKAQVIRDFQASSDCYLEIL